MVAGYDSYNDQRFANNHQSASDYRIIGTNAIIPTGTTNVYPQFLPDGTTQIAWQPILMGTEGTNFRTHSVFYNDNWRVSSRITANLGLRYDRNQGANGVGAIVTRDASLSPRLGVVLDPFDDQKWTITGSVGKYVAGIASSIADVSSPGGNFDAYTFAYLGPAINPNPNAPLLSSADALAQLFAWFDANGGTSRALAGTPVVRGVTPQIRESLKSPHAWEYSGGVGRQIGGRASVRADVTFRKHGDFYAQRTDLSTGRVTDTRTNILPALQNRVYDLTVIENTDRLKRRYAGLTTQGQYRVAASLELGVSYTLSRLWGNVEGETINSGPTASDILQYPEYKQESWNAPEGDLSADQRHRGRVWATYGIPRVTGLSLGLLHIAESGVPYGAVGTINAQNFLTNPGYLSAPASNVFAYYYTARDAFRTDGQTRTDMAINYARRVPGFQRAELFGQIQIVNVFNHYQLCGCGASTVFQNGGAINLTRLDQTVQTPVTSAATVTAFNPFTATPQEGVNWRLAPSFGTALNRQAFTTPRTFRVSFGVRF